MWDEARAEQGQGDFGVDEEDAEEEGEEGDGGG